MGMIQNENEISFFLILWLMRIILGDMDFKLAGTLDGITALQMDTKLMEEILKFQENYSSGNCWCKIHYCKNACRYYFSS